MSGGTTIGADFPSMISTRTTLVLIAVWLSECRKREPGPSEEFSFFISRGPKRGRRWVRPCRCRCRHGPGARRTEWLQDVANVRRTPNGIITFADSVNPDVGALLERHHRAVGSRHQHKLPDMPTRLHHRVRLGGGR